MTTNKSFKSRVRTRMAKTGESYTAARRQLLTKPAKPANPAASAISGQRGSDESLRANTGRDWAAWFALLDGWDATTRKHTAITRWLIDEHGIGNWWAQTITGGYEHARGMRAPGQRLDGSFAANGSRTVAAPVDAAFAAFADEAIRERWLPGVALRIRVANAPKAFRADWTDGTRIAVGFTPKGDGRALVALIHEKLPDAGAAGTMKAYWRERLAALKLLLES